MTLLLLSVLTLGLMCGSELNVAVFSHPALVRQPLDAHVRVRSTFAALLGKVMPFWMVGSTTLNLLLLLPFENLSRDAWRFAAIAFAVQVFGIAFSLIAPVPINNRIKRWTPETVPDDWRSQEGRWDRYHWFRTAALIVAFAMLTLCATVN